MIFNRNVQATTQNRVIFNLSNNNLVENRYIKFHGNWFRLSNRRDCILCEFQVLWRCVYMKYVILLYGSQLNHYQTEEDKWFNFIWKDKSYNFSLHYKIKISWRLFLHTEVVGILYIEFLWWKGVKNKKIHLINPHLRKKEKIKYI